MEADDRQVTTVFTGQPSFHHPHSTEYHEALPSPANVLSHLTSSFADDGNASWYSVCRVPMVEWRLDCENCRHLTVVGLHDTGPWTTLCVSYSVWLSGSHGRAGGMTSASTAGDTGIEPLLPRLNHSTLVAALSGAWRYRVSVRTDWPRITKTGWDRECDLPVLSQCCSTSTRSMPCLGVVACVSKWPRELCQLEYKHLVKG